MARAKSAPLSQRIYWDEFGVILWIGFSQVMAVFVNTLIHGLHHVTIGIMVIPAAYGLLDRSIALALLRHSTLWEMAFELVDFYDTFVIRMFDPEGHKKRPNRIVLVKILHHAAATLLGIPLNLYYSDSQALADFLFMMQGAAAVTIVPGQYVKMFDLEDRSQLRNVQILSLVLMVPNYYARTWGALSALVTFAHGLWIAGDPFLIALLSVCPGEEGRLTAGDSFLLL
eukprot:m.446599 g.446599  ORF g.446599 m.446599 type:complete len:228 (+) comp56869_c0_seq33:332-1015(+)